ncbi:MAG: PD-(D/E)XK nuclease-like domain-containing protein [Peptococcaceae bacterium]|nr:PD-(D/E)XK nuclease-like domain-containing protein [Peptococcaceae bacterium]
MTYQEYEAVEGIRCSDLKLVTKSPAHYMANLINPRPHTPALLFGILVHALVLERDRWEEAFVVAPAVDRRTKAGKAAWTEFEEQSAGRTVIDQDTFDRADGVAGAVSIHPVCRALLQGGETEKTIQWADQGLAGKARLDLYKPGWIVDLKTAASADRDAFTRACLSYQYHMQAAWYIDGTKAAGLGDCNFIFVAVEKDPPYAIACYAPDDEMISFGRSEYQAALTTYLTCEKTDHWPGIGWDYTSERYEIQPIHLPPWVI